MSEEVKKQKRNMRRRELYKQKKEEQKEYIKEMEKDVEKDEEKYGNFNEEIYGYELKKLFKDYENILSKEDKKMIKKGFRKHIEIMTSKSYKKIKNF